MQISSKLSLTYLSGFNRFEFWKKKKKKLFLQKLFLYGEQSHEKFRSVWKKKTRNSFTFVQRDDKNSLFEMECGRTNISAEKRKKKR